MDAVRQILEPAMRERGFGPGGPGLAGDGTVTFLFCTGAADFVARWPKIVDAMRTRVQIDDDRPGTCLDLTVEVSPLGDVRRADFESVDLHRLLADLGEAEAAQRCSPDELLHLEPTSLASQLRSAVELLMPLTDPA